LESRRAGARALRYFRVLLHEGNGLQGSAAKPTKRQDGRRGRTQQRSGCLPSDCFAWLASSRLQNAWRLGRIDLLNLSEFSRCSEIRFGSNCSHGDVSEPQHFEARAPMAVCGTQTKYTRTIRPMGSTGINRLAGTTPAVVSFGHTCGQEFWVGPHASPATQRRKSQ
jgi:hypothetical protein